MADGQREYLQGVIEFYQTRTDTKMTIAAERLAVIAAVTLPVTALSSVLGMNVIVNDSTQVGLLLCLLAGYGRHVGDTAGLGAAEGLVVVHWPGTRPRRVPRRAGEGDPVAMSVSTRPTVPEQRQATAVRTALATVCISGTLEDKLAAAAAAGFDGVEIFEPDLVASSFSPADVRARCADLGLSIDLYQPFRDLDSVDPAKLEAALRRADHKFDVMEELGTDQVLVCSSVAPDALDDDDRIAEQLRRLAARAGERGLRVSYEALAWGRYVNTYERAWEIVRRADHPALGLCIDSFHILSRGSDPAGIRDIPGDKLFFLQLADAPYLDMDVLQWSRHHRLFPGQGTFDLPAFLGHVLSAGYTGALSLEVFNDVFRQSDPRRTAVDAHRSLLALQEATAGHVPVPVRERLAAPPAEPQLAGYAFAEIAVDDGSGPVLARLLTALGFVNTGQHRTKPVQLWRHGGATVLLNASPAATAPDKPGAAVTALGVETADPVAAARRAGALLAPQLHHPHGPAEADLSAVAAPDGTEVIFCRTGAGDATSWLADFTATGSGTRRRPAVPGSATSTTWP